MLTHNKDFHGFWGGLRVKKIDDADFALANNDLVGAAIKFKEAARLSHMLGDIELERKLSALSSIAGSRAGFDGNELPDTGPAIKNALSWKTYLKSLQQAATEAFSRKNYREARYHVSRMVAIAEKIGDDELVANFRQNLGKIDDAIKKYSRRDPR
ncbi:MAG: hypothetical protein Q6353_009700 [Candidatus Sigynarchaeum springense]